FESSLFECDRAGRLPSAAPDAAALMRSCIFGVWYTEELVPLFEYIRETEGTDRPLRLTGVDVQTSSSSAGTRSAFLRDVVGTIDTAYARSVYEQDSAVQTESLPAYRDGSVVFPEGERDSLVAFYDRL